MAIREDMVDNKAVRRILQGANLDRDEMLVAYRAVRDRSLRLCEPLQPEDMVPQSMPDASPTKWHLAHTTWFFEAFVLRRSDRPSPWVRAEYQKLFNSYYNALGPQFPRPRRGLLSRPGVAEVMDYRAEIDSRLERFVTTAGEDDFARLAPLIRLGLHHEQQHQELILTDVKHLLSLNPLNPIYSGARSEPWASSTRPLRWVGHESGDILVGHEGSAFAFDNEGPRHRTVIRPFEIADRLVTDGEYLEFIADGGYERPDLWLSEGWAAVQQGGWRAPLYWREFDGIWHQFTLAGLRPINPSEPVIHLSLFEAGAYATWAGARLPTEFEWEKAAAKAGIDGVFAEDEAYHPAPAAGVGDDGIAPGVDPAPAQVFGDAWEWTSSSYAPYPGYRPAAGAIGEYNGKFMCNQYVLRGGSCATPRAHIRLTYRNFWSAATRFQFAGIRLARDL